MHVFDDLGFTQPINDVVFHPHDNIVAFAAFGPSHPIVLCSYLPGGTVQSTVTLLTKTEQGRPDVVQTIPRKETGAARTWHSLRDSIM